MAAVPNAPELVTITINDTEIQVPKGELIVESVKRLGLEIPIFCYHPRMKAVGMCRMCLVEVGFKQPDGTVGKMPKPQAGCTLPASEGMVVFTDTEMVHRDRKGVLEFLLINHPLDCPICDRGGECPLQNNTLFYGPSTSRYLEIKRHLPKAFPLSKYVTLDLERCIQCGRCVRFTEEISGDHQLAFRFRGAAMQPSTFELREFTSKFSGNTIEICPVGALTSAQFRFRARPWDLETKPAICTICSNGCNVWFDYRAGKFVRTNGRTNEAVNEEWTCDRGKFGHDWYNDEKRLTKPLVRRGDRFVETNWAAAYELILQAFAPGGNRVAGLVKADVSNEALYLMQRVFREAFGSNNLDHRRHGVLPGAAERLGEREPIAELEAKRSILVFGTSLEDSLPIVFLRVRKAWFNRGTKVIAATARVTELDSFAHVKLTLTPEQELATAQGLLEAVRSAKSGRVSTDSLSVAAAALIEGPSSILATTELYGLAEGARVVDTLAELARELGCAFGPYSLDANDQGALELGILPDSGPGGLGISGEPGLGTKGILEGCAAGSVKALWLVNADPTQLGERELAERALENVEFLVYQACLSSEAMAYASVVLPMAAPAEQDGTYTNCERRVQRLAPVLWAPGEAKPSWRIFAEMLLRAKPTRPYFNPNEVMEEIVEQVVTFAGARYGQLEGEGVLLGRAEAPVEVAAI